MARRCGCRSSTRRRHCGTRCTSTCRSLVSTSRRASRRRLPQVAASLTMPTLLRVGSSPIVLATASALSPGQTAPFRANDGVENRRSSPLWIGAYRDGPRPLPLLTTQRLLVILLVNHCEEGRMSSASRVAALVTSVTVSIATLAYATTPSHVHVELELNLSASGDWHAGEPGVAVDPRNQNSVVAVWAEQDATGIYRNAVTGTFDTLTGTIGYATDPAASRCGVAFSRDAGRTWRRTVLPAQTAQSTLCSDATIAAGPDGTFYAAVITFAQPTMPVPGITPGTLPHLTNVEPARGSADFCIRSTDGGCTWSSPPINAIGNRTAADRARYAPGTHPATGGEGTCDRPWITVDQQTNTVYVVGTADAIQFNGSTKNETWVTASHNGARSFGTVYPVDSAQFPQSGAASIAAGNGVLAVAYSGHRADQSADGVVFETSRNAGKTFHRHVFAAPMTSSAPFGVYLAGDPARAGHYAVAVPSSGDN